MQTIGTSGPDSARLINLRLHKLEDPPDFQKRVRRLGASRAAHLDSKTNNRETNVGEETSQRQEALVREWVARWQQTRRDGHAVVACHPFGCEASQ
jgi:hypothetical protein